MSEGEIPVRWEPLGRTVHVPDGTRVLTAAVDAGVVIDGPCGGHGTCGKCKVRVLDDAPPVTETERGLLEVGEIEDGIRLACQTYVHGPCTIELLDESPLTSTHQILGASGESTPLDVSGAAVRKRFIELPRPNRDDPVPDRARVRRLLGPVELDVHVLRVLPRRLRDADWRGTAVLYENRLIDFEYGDTTAECYGVAFDVGTTTIVGVLLDLATGLQRAARSRMNPQIPFGDDVLSRILHVSRHSDGLNQLQQAVVDEVNAMIGQLAEDAGAPVERIYDAAFSGNTTMLHLLTGIDPRALGEVPFAPAFGEGLRLPAADMGIAIHPRGRAYVFPVIGGFVGGDTVACVLSTDLAHANLPTVLVDIGTNGEIVVCHDGCLLAASTAAGPAFEGARIADGMRAATGAIEHVRIEDDVHIDVIGNGPPVGLCGSALIDLAAGLLRCRILSPRGILVGPNDATDDVAPALRHRIAEDAHGPVFIVAPGETTETGKPVRLTQRDVREFQLATAAIRSGVGILLGHVGLAPPDVARVLIAGGFGNYLNTENAQRVGLLPNDVPAERIEYIGNASLAGARLAVASRKARGRAERLARTIRHVDLSLDPDFQTAFAMAMQFPEVP